MISHFYDLSLNNYIQCVGLFDCTHPQNIITSNRCTLAHNIINNSKPLTVPNWNSENSARGPLYTFDSDLNQNVWQFVGSTVAGQSSILGCQNLLDGSNRIIIGVMYKPLSTANTSLIARLDAPTGGITTIISNKLWYTSSKTFGQNSRGFQPDYNEGWLTWWWIYHPSIGAGYSTRSFFCDNGQIFLINGNNALQTFDVSESSINYGWTDLTTDYSLASNSITNFNIGSKTWRSTDSSEVGFSSGTTLIKRVIVYNGFNNIPEKGWMNLIKLQDKIFRSI